jgi:ATP-dependent Clp protease ATP-binding subunit ClpB
LKTARKAIAEIEDKLQPLKAAYETEKARGDKIQQARKRLDELKAKVEDAERRYEVGTARRRQVLIPVQI